MVAGVDGHGHDNRPNPPAVRCLHQQRSQHHLLTRQQLDHLLLQGQHCQLRDPHHCWMRWRYLLLLLLLLAQWLRVLQLLLEGEGVVAQAPVQT